MNERRLYHVLLGSYTTEKSTILAEKNRQVVLIVAVDATKTEIKQAVEKMFNVTVMAVRVVNVKGKTRRFRNKQGHCSNYKKALVSLNEGHDINFGEFE